MNGVTFENDETASVFVVDPTLTADEMQGRGCQRGGRAVVTGRDDGGDTHGAQHVDDRLFRLAVAGGAERAATKAQVDGRDVAGGVHGVDTLEARDEVGGIRAHAWRVEQAAVRDRGEF